MGKWLSCICVALALLGCSNNSQFSGEQPPTVSIQFRDQMYETTLGTYCWATNNFGRCVDTGGPVELLKGDKPIPVNPNEEITFVMDHEPKPNKFHVTQTSEAGQTEVAIKDNRITAPAQKGIYYYSYGVWWMDEKVANLSHGDAFYAFVLEVL